MNEELTGSKEPNASDIKLQIGGQTEDCSINTGFAYNMLSISKLKQLKLSDRLQLDKQDIELINGSQMQSFGQANLDVIMDGITYDLSFKIILPELAKIQIGTNSLNMFYPDWRRNPKVQKVRQMTNNKTSVEEDSNVTKAIKELTQIIREGLIIPSDKQINTEHRQFKVPSNELLDQMQTKLDKMQEQIRVLELAVKKKTIQGQVTGDNGRMNEKHIEESKVMISKENKKKKGY